FRFKVTHIHTADRDLIRWNLNHVVLVILRFQPDERGIRRPAYAFERAVFVVIDEGRYNLPVVVGPGCVSHIYDIAVFDTCADHGVAFDSEREVWLALVWERVVDIFFDVLFGEKTVTGAYGADEGDSRS